MGCTHAKKQSDPNICHVTVFTVNIKSARHGWQKYLLPVGYLPNTQPKRTINLITDAKKMHLKKWGNSDSVFFKKCHFLTGQHDMDYKYPDRQGYGFMREEPSDRRALAQTA